MKLDNCKLIFIAIGLIGILLISSPALIFFINFPGGEKFSEIYILGPEHMAENVPFNVQSNTPYTVYLGVGNHEGDASYYLCFAKLRNQTQSFPDDTTGTPANLIPLYEYRVFLQNKQNVETPLVFSLSDPTVELNRMTLPQITINNITFDVDAQTIWDYAEEGFYYQLLLELWSFNKTSNNFEFQSFSYFWLNMTSPV